MCVCICMCVRVCARVCACACVYACMWQEKEESQVIFLAMLLGNTKGKIEVATVFQFAIKRVNLFIEMSSFSTAIFHLFQYFLHRSIANH